eukprot:4099315-Pyramimonas_sp.AAC.1
MTKEESGPESDGDTGAPLYGDRRPTEARRARSEVRRGDRIGVPPLAPAWMPLARWRPLYFGKWRITEHTNINETRA